MVPLAVLLLACDPAPAGEVAATAAVSTASAPAAFDVEGFCERVMAVSGSRRCEGDDTLIEGNKVGYCTTLLREARDAERVRFDAAAAAACEAAVKGASDLPDRRVLHDLSLRLPACREVVTGTQAEGAACEHAMECAAGLLCLAKTCQAPAKEGQVCRELRDDGFTWATSTCAPPLTCRSGACAAAEPKEEPGAAGAPCVAEDDCQPALHCAAGKGAAGAAAERRTCAPRKKAGEPCSSSDECLGRCSRSDGSTCVSYCGSG